MSEKQEVIVVEDDKDIMPMLKIYFSTRPDILFHYATTATEAMELIEKHGLDTSVLVVDNELPEKTGDTPLPNARRLEAAYLALNQAGNVIHTSSRQMDDVKFQYGKPFGSLDELLGHIDRLSKRET